MRSLLLFLLTAALLAPAAPARASFPGRNGDLVLAVDDGSCEIGSNLFTATPKGKAFTQITDVCAGEDDEANSHYIGGPEAAPDGKSLLAFTDTVPTGLVSLEPDGTQTTPVKVPEGVGYDSLSGSAPVSFAPDGKSFVARTDAGTLYEVFLDGSPARVITPKTSLRNPRVSPDGKLIAGVKPSGLVLVSFETGETVRRVVKRRDIADLDWSPDGKRLVYATGYEQQEVGGGAKGGNLFLVNRNGKRHRTLVHRPRIAETEPTWAPDGKSIAWVSLGFSGGDVGFNVYPSLWRVSLKSGKRTKLRKLEQPFVEEGYYHAPELTWLPR